MKLFADQEDELHGNFIRMQMEFNGVQEEVLVSEKWLRLKKNESERQKSPKRWIKINFAGPNGDRIDYLEIGADIPHQEVDEKIDLCTQELFGIYLFQDGEEMTYLVEKWMWDQLKNDVTSIVDEKVKQCMDGSGDISKITEVEKRYTGDGLQQIIEERIRRSQQN